MQKHDLKRTYEYKLVDMYCDKVRTTRLNRSDKLRLRLEYIPKINIEAHGEYVQDDYFLHLFLFYIREINNNYLSVSWRATFSI